MQLLHAQLITGGWGQLTMRGNGLQSGAAFHSGALKQRLHYIRGHEVKGLTFCTQTVGMFYRLCMPDLDH